VPVNSALQKKKPWFEKSTSRHRVIDLEGIHFADFSPNGRLLLERHVQNVMQFLPFLSQEFLKNIITTTFIEWQRITGLKVENISQTRNLEDLRSQLEEVWELFKRNIELFLLNPEDIQALGFLKQNFNEKHSHLQDLSE
jgi:hypothetical protein